MDDSLFVDGDTLTTYSNLANAIIIKAVEDYKEALTYNNTRTIRDCEKFFRSEWFTFLTDLDGEHIMEYIQKEIKENENNRTKL